MYIRPNDNHLRLRRILCHISPHDLDHLCIVLEQPGGPAFVIAMAEALLAITGAFPPQGPSALRSPAARRQRERLYYVFNDRRRFPGTRDLLDQINAGFGFDFTYAEFRQVGRLDLMTRTWSRLLAMSEQERTRKVADFLAAVGEQEEQNARE